MKAGSKGLHGVALARLLVQRLAPLLVLPAHSMGVGCWLRGPVGLGRNQLQEG